MKTYKKFSMTVLGLLLAGVLFLWGCGAETPATTAASSLAETSGQRLYISGTVTDDHVTKDYPVPGTERVVSVAYLDDVTVELDGKAVLLKQALEQGQITPEEVAAWARLDAVDGYCGMMASSERGLSRFFYYYENIIVEVVNDVYETPDGKQHLIETVDVYARGKGRADASHTYHGDDGYPIDREDWGLTFEVKDVTSTGMTLVCTQSGGGHQVGALTLDSFVLYNSDTADFVRKADDSIGHEIKNGEEPAVIAPEEATRFVIDWTETFGEIPSGNYYIEVTVLDVFDRESVHPLLVKYQYSQRHGIEFSIP